MSIKYNNFYYEKDDKYHKKGEERQNVNLRIALADLTDSRDDLINIGLDTSLKYSSHILRETIVNGELYEVELVKLNGWKWYAIQIFKIVDYDQETGTPSEYRECSLKELKEGATMQLNLFDGFSYDE